MAVRKCFQADQFHLVENQEPDFTYFGESIFLANKLFLVDNFYKMDLYKKKKKGGKKGTYSLYENYINA